MKEFLKIIPAIEKELQIDIERIYENSYTVFGKDRFVLCKAGYEKFILLTGGGQLYEELFGEELSCCKICKPSHKNRLVFNKYLDYTVPKAFGRKTATMGLGDRLGLASPAHIRAIKGRDIKPILAQQSKRELYLTGRTYRDVLDDVCYAVLQEGYTGSFGADGDHLKEEADIENALSCGYSMITLDCSEKIDGRVENYSEKALSEEYAKLPKDTRNYYENFYMDRSFTVHKKDILFRKATLEREVLLYNEAIDFTEHIFKTHIKNSGREIDFEISLDETEYPTTSSGHWLVANELKRRNIDITSLAPRFIGEFQKGIDYIGNIEGFEQDFKAHTDIADYFGYKLSIHSGSDKFSIFGLIGEYTKNKLHIKTSGTNWLEAVKVIITTNPDLYRKIHSYALLHLNEAKAFYHVDADASRIKEIDDATDDELIGYMDEKHARQLLHITYGFLLKAEVDGKLFFRDDIYATLIENEDLYYQYLINHIEKHLGSLGFKRE